VGLITLTGGAEDVMLDFAARSLIKKAINAQSKLKEMIVGPKL
jgi:hypothetical protein